MQNIALQQSQAAYMYMEPNIRANNFQARQNFLQANRFSGKAAEVTSGSASPLQMMDSTYQQNLD